MLRASGLRAVLERDALRLGTRHLSTLSYILGSAFCARLALLMVDRLAPARFGDRLVAIDGMAVMLPATRRHNCAKCNSATVGGGVLWAVAVQARRGDVSPLRILRTVAGAFSDAVLLRSVELEARGPLYLMDRGCFALDLAARWLVQGVRFVVRMRGGAALVYEPVRTLGPARGVAGAGRRIDVEFDGTAVLGAAGRRGPRPLVRLVVARMVRGGKTEQLVLASGEMHATAEQLLAAYRRRWEIERFHKLLKRVLGLAHLYSFRRRGLEFLLAVCVLAAVLLWARPRDADTIPQLRDAVAAVRRTLHVHRIWTPNTVGSRHWHQPPT